MSRQSMTLVLAPNQLFRRTSGWSILDRRQQMGQLMPAVVASLMYLATTPLEIFSARAVASKLSLAL